MRLNLSADVEGLDIYESEDRRVLLASSQGDDTFVAYDIETGKVLSKFHVGESLDGKTDEVTHTDGISILSKAVRGTFNSELSLNLLAIRKRTIKRRADSLQ